MSRLRVVLVCASALLGAAGSACSRNSEVTVIEGLPKVVPGSVPHSPTAVAAEVAPTPASPPGPGGQPLSWPQAPELTGVRVVPGRDSALLILPRVEGARDFRAFILSEGVTPAPAGSTGNVGVLGAAVHCAGFRQLNAPATGSLELLQQLEVAGLKGRVRVVVEAVDTPCPFPGLLGREHVDLAADPADLPQSDWLTFSVFTEQEVRARYGSLIVNGHGPAPRLAQPAPAVQPRVLARTTLWLTPDPSAPAPLATFFDDFADEEQPVLVGPADEAGRGWLGKHFRNSRWNFYTYNADIAQFHVARGQLHMVLADWEQDVFGHTIAYPRKPARVSGTDYLHVRFDVASNSTGRRYWWVFMCGAETAGATLNADGSLQRPIIQSSFFYQPDGRNPSTAGWNCLQVFPRDGMPFPMPPNDTQPQSDIRVMVNRANAGDRTSVVNVSPRQQGSPDFIEPGWFRQQAAGGNVTAPILDDQLLIAPATRYDMYVRRDRVILYVNGEQRLCNDFPRTPLTFAEAALGFGQVLYHSSAERQEFLADFWDRSGQVYYRSNTPYADVRSWDNLGFAENVAAPPGFDAGRCYVHQG